MKLLRKIVRLLSASLVSLALIVPASVPVAVVVAPTPAYAGLDACVALATSFGLNDVKKVASFVADHGQCVGDLSNPSFLAVVAAVLIIEQSTSAFNDLNSCEAALGGIAGKPIAAAVAAIGSALNLPASAIADLQKFASDEGSQGLVEFMNATPGLNVISNNWSCACAVRYSGVVEKLQEILKNLASCTGGILESGLDALGNFYEDTFGGTTPGTMYAEDYPPQPCPGGWQQAVYSQTVQQYQSWCGCYDGSTMVWGADKKNFVCRCPGNKGYAGGKCFSCGENGFPQSNGQCKTCGYGEKVGKSGSTTACVPKCASNEMMSAGGTGNKCQTCNAGYAPSFYSSTSSSGICKPCAPGTTSKAGSATCSPKCKDWEKWDPKTAKCNSQCGENEKYTTPKEFGFACISCGAGKKYDITTNTCGCEAWEKLDTTNNVCKRICPEGQKWTDMHSPAGTYNSLTCQPCPKGSEFNNRDNKCQACPGTMNWAKNSAGIGVCTCPEGTNRQGSVCAPNQLTPGAPKLDEPVTDKVAPGTKIEERKTCPMGWGWSPTAGKCKPGLKGQPPQAPREIPQGAIPSNPSPAPSSPTPGAGPTIPTPQYVPPQPVIRNSPVPSPAPVTGTSAMPSGGNYKP